MAVRRLRLRRVCQRNPDELPSDFAEYSNNDPIMDLRATSARRQRKTGRCTTILLDTEISPTVER